MPAHVASDGLRLHVEIDGDRGAPTVVLVHGLAGSVQVGWRATGVIDRLVSAGLRTVAFDLRGHGRSDAPASEDRYGDRRMAEDVHEILEQFGGRQPVLVGYSMGAALVLLALEAGTTARAAVIGAAPRAVLAWTDQDEAMRSAALNALRGEVEADDAATGAWLSFLDAMGMSRDALAAVLCRHRPVVEHWDRITTPCVFVAGASDTMAAVPSDVATRLAGSRAITVPGDHITAAASPEFTDIVVGLTTD